MGRDFYGSDANDKTNLEEPLVPQFIKDNEEVRSITLPNGNSVIEPLAVTETIHNIRKNIIAKKEYVEAEIETQKSAFRNEVANVKQYWRDNVFVDRREFDEHFVTASVFALGGWLIGSVVSNKRNWGFNSPWNSNSVGVLQRHPTAFSRIPTSFPMRLALPWVIAGSVYSQLTPNTWYHAVSAFKRDVLPKEFVDQASAAYSNLYEKGLKVKLNAFSDSSYETLKAAIGEVRETIAKNIK